MKWVEDRAIQEKERASIQTRNNKGQETNGTSALGRGESGRGETGEEGREEG